MLKSRTLFKEIKILGHVQTLLIIYFIFVIIRFLISLLFQQPVLMGDEYIYKKMAYHFYLNRTFSQTTQLPNFIYQLLISGSFFFNDNFHVVIKLLNSMMINLVIFPVYLFMKQFLKQDQINFYFILILFMPFFNMVNHLMPENLFFPFFLFSFYATYCFINQPLFKNSVFTAIILALFFLIKPHAMAFILAFSIIYLYRLVFLTRAEERKDFLLKGLVIVFLFSFLIIILKLIFVGPQSLSFFSGFYSGLGKEAAEQFDWKRVLDIKIIYMIISHLCLISFIYLVPILASLFLLKDFIKEKKNKESFFLIYGWLIFIAQLAMVILFTVAMSYRGEDLERVHLRYYFMTFPFFMLALLCFYPQLKWNKFRSALLLICFLLSGVFFFLIFLPQIFPVARNFFVGDVMNFTWLSYARLIPGFVPGIYLISSGVIVYYLFSSRKKIEIYLVYFLFMACLANLGQIIFTRSFSDQKTALLKPKINFIQSIIPDRKTKTAIIAPDYFYENFIKFWLVYPYSGVKKIGRDKVVQREMIAADVAYLITFDDYQINFPVYQTYQIEGCRIYLVKDEQNVINRFTGLSLDYEISRKFEFRSNAEYDRLKIEFKGIKTELNPVLIADNGKNELKVYLKKNNILELSYAESYHFILSGQEQEKDSSIHRGTGIKIKTARVYY